MELLRGEDLGERLKRLRKALPPGEVMTYLEQTALALDKTHARAIVHRDLKPQNLFLAQREDGSSRITILDFGIAKVVHDGATAAGATQSLGTPLYMAPEQFGISTKITPATDIYALGMVAYTLLVGRAYWRKEARGSRPCGGADARRLEGTTGAGDAEGSAARGDAAARLRCVVREDHGAGAGGAFSERNGGGAGAR